MKLLKLYMLCLLPLLSFSIDVSNNLNGESIYKAGKNLQGERMLDRSASRIKIVRSCSNCHGKHGDAMRGTSIKFSDLSNPAKHLVPITIVCSFVF